MDKGGSCMNFNHLEYAVAVAKSGSISKAAQRLFLSQPYLSGMIKGLEEELGYRIFERNKAGVELTELGEEFIKSAKLILLELQKIRELDTDDAARQLNLSCYYASYIMEMFLKFKKASPLKLSDKIKEMGNLEVLESVLTGESMMGFIFYAQEKRQTYYKLAEEMGLEIRELFRPMTIYAIMSRSHPLAEGRQLSIQDLFQYPYVSYEDESSRQYLKLLGLEAHPQLLEVSDRGSFYDALTSGEYLSVMAFLNLPKIENMALIPFQDKRLFMNSSYVTAKNHRLTKREREFLGFIKRNK